MTYSGFTRCRCCGERPGESSLPFSQFVARVYAFHFNTSTLGDPGDVAPVEVEGVVHSARDSWGTSYSWLDPVPGRATVHDRVRRGSNGA